MNAKDIVNQFNEWEPPMSIPPDLNTRVAELERNAPHLHPAVHNLFALLPEPGAPFNAEARVNFLTAAACLFNLLYEPVAMKIELDGLQ